MAVEKKSDPTAKQAETADNNTGRKAWVPKTPAEVILEQIKKQESKVADLQQQVQAEQTMLNKLLQMKKILEAS